MKRAVFAGFCRAATGVAMMLIATVVYAASTHIVATLRVPGDKVHFFLNDGTYLRFDVRDNAVDSGYPKNISDSSWPGMGGYALQIAAAFNGPRDKVYFFLVDGRYLRYDTREAHVDSGYPKLINDANWPGLGRYRAMITDALNWPGNKVQFFLNDGTYLRYDMQQNRVDEGYPKVVNDKTWPGLGQYAKNLTSMVRWSDSVAYFFLDNGDYLRYNIAEDRVDAGYPQRITDRSWPGMGQVFNRHRHRSMP
jgi:hypothetical protein